MSMDRIEPRKAGEQIPFDLRAFAHASQLIRERFEVGPSIDRLAYHNREHTEGVVRRARKIAEAMDLPAREKILVQIAASFHDTVQRWELTQKEDGAALRKRQTTTNELASADEAVAWMKKQADARFTNEECAIVHAAIRVTIPVWNEVYGTVYQDALRPESHPVVRAVALADIGSSGMEPSVFQKEGDWLFAEQEIDIIKAIRNAQSSEDISPEKQTQYLERYRAWIKSQIGFAQGRQALFEDELGDLDEASTDRVRHLFAHFAEGIEAAEENSKIAEKCTFEQMARRLVPTAFSAGDRESQ